jgi:hypothetical protein
MRLGELSARGVPGEFFPFDGKASLWRSVHTEQPVRERQVRGPNWRQALQVKVPARMASTIGWYRGGGSSFFRAVRLQRVAFECLRDVRRAAPVSGG